jgi:hypothetical protein
MTLGVMNGLPKTLTVRIMGIFPMHAKRREPAVAPDAISKMIVCDNSENRALYHSAMEFAHVTVYA